MRGTDAMADKQLFSLPEVARELGALTVALVTNTIVKLGISLVMGAGTFRRYVAIALGITAVVGALVGVLVARF